jgi:hypothetical protein
MYVKRFYYIGLIKYYDLVNIGIPLIQGKLVASPSPNVFQNTLLSNTWHSCDSLKVRDLVSQPQKCDKNHFSPEDRGSICL